MGNLVREFLVSNEIFSRKEWDVYLHGQGSRNPQTRNTLLQYHLKKGHVRRIRRGLYSRVRLQQKDQDLGADSYLLAASLTDDAVLAYHTALQFLGHAYTIHNLYTFLTNHEDVRPFQYQGVCFRPVCIPQALKRASQENIGVLYVERGGKSIRVTSTERTFVDVLDRPDLSGGFEEIWLSLESLSFLDFSQVYDYVRLLGNATTASRVGFYLEQHRQELMVDDSILELLISLRPKSPHYMSGKRKGKFIARWNLIVPYKIVEQSWNEVI